MNARDALSDQVDDLASRMIDSNLELMIDILALIHRGLERIRDARFAH